MTSEHKETPASAFSSHVDDGEPTKTFEQYLEEGYVPLDALTCACCHLGNSHSETGRFTCVGGTPGFNCACQRFAPVRKDGQRIIPRIRPAIPVPDERSSWVDYAAVLAIVGGVADAMCHYLGVLPWGPWK